MIPVLTISGVAGAVFGLVLALVSQSRTRRAAEADRNTRRDERRSEMQSRDAKRRGQRSRRLEGRHQARVQRLRRDLEKAASRRERLESRRPGVEGRAARIDQGFDDLNRRRRQVRENQKRARGFDEDLTTVRAEQRERVTEETGLQVEDLSREVLEAFEAEVRHEQSRWLRRHVEDLQELRHDLAEDLVDRLISRLQLKATVIPADNRIAIKKKAFPQKVMVPESPVLTQVAELTGVECLFDEAGETLIVSAYDGVAREGAVRLVEKILRDRKDAPEWIAQQHEAVVKRLEREMTRSAGDLFRRLKIKDIPVEVVRLQGRTSRRTSFGQVVLDHQLEVGFLCGMLAQELGGFDLTSARYCGFVHDIGKALDVVQEGAHPQLGGDFLVEHKVDDEDVVGACYHHHDPFDAEHLLTAVTTACDAISAGRPGARRESIDSYVERVESLEKIAREPREAVGVAVMQAGREIQVNVNPKSTSDEDLQSLGDAIAARIEEDLVYPGEIRVNIVRETQVKVTAR